MTGRWEGRPPLTPALGLVGVVSLGLGAANVGLALVGPGGRVLPAVLYAVVGWVYVAAGLVAWSRRPAIGWAWSWWPADTSCS